MSNNQNNEKQNKEGRKPQATKIVELVSESNITLFHNELKQPYAYIEINNHSEIWPCESRQFKDWLGHIFWNNEGKSAYPNAINGALSTLRAKALYEGQKYKLNNRVAIKDGAIWYDLSNNNWEAVRISKNGWRIIGNPPIIFQRFSHQQEQLTPVPEGNIKDVLSLINVKKEHQLLLLVYLVSCFIPDFPHPILVVHGPQGSSKSMLSKVLKSLVDPSVLETCDFPASKAELAQILSHHHYVVFDNLSYLSDSNSDILCRAVTGGGFSKRELYTNDEDVIHLFKRCINLNGINPVATKPDLLERSILLELERIPNEKRKKETDILQQFETKRPEILGAILNTVAKAMEIKESIKVTGLPRMADFTEWGCAIAEAIGHPKEEFLSSYFENIKSQNDQVIYDSPVCSTLLSLMKEREQWNGTATQLLSELIEEAERLNINTKEKGWPKSAASLSGKLNNYKTNLEEAGIKINRFDENRQRQLSISNDSAIESQAGNGLAEEDDRDAATLSTLFPEH
ncbi:MAG: hypothetical protein COV29_00240 [Candidatus Yanofskybacteria bacterium CG10_big_fil_rev_8_21_14_0_10_36_16]|uniref:ATP-binding protein n=1 Tax=Candidatus Yanofskybacteria bacterium CG10_big_fil_rev_8_21_14_0_10_36_16 TaxID=1975096 RepID=A0A2J0Q8J3_9BACT|nr:MAG: hypothetical protein COV29_00240 [Candidatus Yanofskybacteria bacterium CG10_big_fil_rev_8_21_14_0_10_36_16]